MIFTLKNVLQGIASVITAGLPEYAGRIYFNANQQGTEYPCFFLFFMPSTVEDEVGNRYLRDLGVDIVFVQQRNVVNGQEEILEVADYLDGALDLLPYSDGGTETALLHTCERQWQVEDEELHYQFHIRERISLPEDFICMQILEEEHVDIE